MDILLPINRGSNKTSGICVSMTRKPDSVQYLPNEIVQYYSSSNRKWYETRIIKVNQDKTLDLACRKNVDQTLVRKKGMTSGPRELNIASDKDIGILSYSQENTKKQCGNEYEIGTKVEYYSDSLNNWILSTVKAKNHDGTYRLNTKKRADAFRIRPLNHQHVSSTNKTVPSSTVIFQEDHSCTITRRNDYFNPYCEILR
jgi:hypothetical protein